MIFDLDGTLVDSEGLCSRAFLDLVPELDLSLEDMVARCRGQKLAHILGDIEEHISRSLPAGFEQEYRARVASLWRRTGSALPPTESSEECTTLCSAFMLTQWR